MRLLNVLIYGKKALLFSLIGFTVLLSLRQEGRAMIVPAQMASQAPEAGVNRQEDLAKIQKILENKMIRQRLSQMGLTEKEVEDRLSKLSDQDVHQLASKMDSIMPAGDSAGGVIIGILVITILVLLVIYLIKRV